jgi:hypothetical protein
LVEIDTGNLYMALLNSPLIYFDEFGLAAIAIQQTRESTGRFGTYGTLTITSNNNEANKCCGLPKTFRTLEPPYGRTIKKIHTQSSTNPTWERDLPAGPRSNRTSPLGLNREAIPPRPVEVNQADFDNSINMELHYDGSYNIHSGTNPTHSWGCILLGTAFVEAVVPGDPSLQPGTERGMNYVAPGFGQTDTRESHIRFNAAIACVERLTGEKSTFSFKRKGNPTMPKDLADPMPMPPEQPGRYPRRAVPINDDGLNIPYEEASLPIGGTGVPTREPRPAGGFGGGFLNIFRRNRN